MALTKLAACRIYSALYNAAAMKLYRWNDIQTEHLSETVSRQVLHADMMTIARLLFKQGAVVPRHSHANEQITTVESGRLLFTFDEDHIIVERGESLQIPGNLAHRVEALEDSVAVDVFSPPRQDWISGDDAYLRSAR